ncbi:hypothetical protein WCX72_08875 [Sulfurimonas sp. HSL1-6]|uniref:hypothetical protein n=1 Tax=Thiomicrolovo immobilis TaxID=3131935 RepID=UPI0031F8D208
MKRTIDAEEIRILFFTAYFLYGRSKYGSSERGDVRLGRMGAYRGIMQLCRAAMDAPSPCLRSGMIEGCRRLEAQTEGLPEGTFKTAYLETLTLLRRRIA